MIHRALLAGLLSHIGMREDTGPRGASEYAGRAARRPQFAICPGSALAEEAAALGDGRRAGRDLPAVGRGRWPGSSRSGPRRSPATWSCASTASRTGPSGGPAVVATERVTLYGLPIVVGRKVDYARIDPELARELFIRHALVEGDWETQHRVLRRRTGRCWPTWRSSSTGPGGGTSWSTTRRCSTSTTSGSRPTWCPARHFDAWWKKARRPQPELLAFTRELLLDPCRRRRPARIPTEWRQGGLALPLTYQFEPGAADDGVTVEVPLAAAEPGSARTASTGRCPALREELVTALIRSLPKPLRRNFVPAPDVARAVLARLVARRGAAGRRAGPGAAPGHRGGRAARRLATGRRCRRTCG